jgi:hypothetical protein
MMMTPGVRKFALTTHVTSSVGWVGSVAAFLALAVAGVISLEAQTVRAAYLAMPVTTWFVIVPFCLAALVTGLVQSWSTTWGLFRHYWVVTKLVLTVLATIILLLHTQSIDRMAVIAAETTLSSTDFHQLRLQLVGDAAAAIFVLFITTTLSIYKPWGLTPYGLRKQYGAAPAWRPVARRPTTMGRQVLFGIGALLFGVLLWHLFGGGLHGH